MSHVTRLALAAALFSATPAFADFTFSDSFSNGPSPDWSNLRGNWFGHDGLYDAAAPTNAPPTMTSLPWSLGDLSLDVDINGLSDGGLWLHADAQAANGVLLVTGGGGWGSGNRDGQSGNTLYFHLVHDNSYSAPIDKVFPGITPGENDHLHITIVGDTYSVYLNGGATPALSVTTPDFPMGRVGLYDYSSLQTFDNLALTSATLPGDANHNGVIDADDYALIDRGFNKHLTTFSDGDFNADHMVDAADYTILNQSLLRQSAAPSAFPVPEPALLTCLLATPLLTRRRR